MRNIINYFYPVKENKRLLLKRGTCMVGPTTDIVIGAGLHRYFCELLLIALLSELYMEVIHFSLYFCFLFFI